MIAAIVGSLVALLALAIAVASAAGTRRFVRRYDAEKADLLRRGRETPRPVAEPGAHPDLPAPVRRYLEVTRYFQNPGLETAVLRQRGALRPAPGKRWLPFEAEQAYAVEPPGFVWLARGRLAPLVQLLARDAFVGGTGNMRINLAGLFTVADALGPELDQGAGLRYWGEILVFPEVVTSPYLRWTPVDERSARLSIAQGGLATSAVVEFDAAGYVRALHADRYRDVDGKGVLTPWSGHFREWRGVRGRAFPTRWDSVWHLPEGDFEAVRVEVVDVRTE
jgi:uncharacterized protein DUF6544